MKMPTLRNGNSRFVFEKTELYKQGHLQDVTKETIESKIEIKGGKLVDKPRKMNYFSDRLSFQERGRIEGAFSNQSQSFNFSGLEVEEKTILCTHILQYFYKLPIEIQWKWFPCSFANLDIGLVRAIEFDH
jgi:hypothetical protein